MCGICGIVPMPGADLDVNKIKDEMKVLLAMAQQRGADATGIFRAGKNPCILKGNIPAENFVETEEFNNFFTESCAYIGHTRKATKGTPDDYKNNHPLWVENYVVTHNGSVTNVTHEKTGADVDSIWFPWKINKERAKSKRDFEKILQEVNGTYALAIYNLKNTFYLVRDDQEQRAVYYSLTKDYLRYSQIKEMTMSELEPYEMLVVNNNGFYKWNINIYVPVELIEAIERVSVKNKTPQQVKREIIKTIEMIYSGKG